LRHFFAEFLQGHGFDFPKRYTEVDSTVVGRSLLYKADRIAILSYFHVEQDIRWGRLSTLPLALPDAGRKIGILTKEDYVPTPLVVAFIDALRAVSKQMQQDALVDPAVGIGAEFEEAQSPT
jgi:DNA-binding transcriptional LysR family regulator